MQYRFNCGSKNVQYWTGKKGRNTSTNVSIGFRSEEHRKRSSTYSGADTLSGSFITQRWRRMPSQSWTPTIPKMKNTKKHNSNTLPSMGRVSSNSMTRIRIPKGKHEKEWAIFANSKTKFLVIIFINTKIKKTQFFSLTSGSAKAITGNYWIV